MDRAKVTFFDDNTGLYVTYELIYKSFGSEVADDIILGFQILTGHYSRRSRDQVWRSVGRFCQYLGFIGFPNGRAKVDVVVGFAWFLENAWPLNKANRAYYNFIRRLVKWLGEETEKPLWSGHDLESVRFLRKDDGVHGNDLPVDALKNIVNACKREIAQVKRKFNVRLLIEAGKAGEIEELPASKIYGLSKLIEFEASNIWSLKDLLEAGCPVKVGDGVKELAGYKELTQQACLPLFLLLMIQTAANPYALMEIDQDCLETNPLDEGSSILKWNKGRASKLQNIATMKKGNYSVHTIVNLVRRMTRPIRGLASAADKKLLFITRSGNKAKRLNGSGLHAHLADFRNRNNLSYFTFSDIRRAVAEATYTKTGSVTAVSKVLQHRSLTTTEIYLKGDVVKQQRYGNLARFQGMMLAIVGETPRNETPQYETALGFKCASPLSGSIGRSKKGEPCLEFLMCAGCRNALVPIDDPQVIARIIRARDCLNVMEKSSHLDHDLRIRYTKVFQPILDIIDRDILSCVNKSTLKKAEKLALGLSRLPVMY